jgi:flagellar hook protein FlgE
MIRSMSSAISGMRNHQLMLDVVSSDISNVSTIGFKSSNILFSDVLSQTLQAGDPQGVVAGTNPAQVGLGSRLAGTAQNFAQGALQRTGRTTDLAIEGDGFFIVNNANAQLYTRNGSFSFDAQGNLSTADGWYVMGWQADPDGMIDPTGPLTRLRVPIGSAMAPVQTTEVSVSGNLNAAAAIGTRVSNSVAAYNAQGAEVVLNVSYTKTAANQWTVSATHGDPATQITLTDNVLTFDITGELTIPVDRNINIAAGQIPGITEAMTIEMGAATTPNRVTQYGSQTNVSVIGQNGSFAGALQSFNVSNGGSIMGVYSNGKSVQVGQVAISVFTNPQGLERVAGGWRETGNSGLPQIGQAAAFGRGKISAGTLELSNVDLAEEFSRLVVAQRGFQGNARVITASDEILQEVVRLGR